MYTQIVKSFLLIIFCGLANTSLGQYTAPQPVKSSSYDRNIITQDTVPARIQIDSVSWRDLSPQREKKFWRAGAEWFLAQRSEEHTSELQSRENLVCRLLLEK